MPRSSVEEVRQASRQVDRDGALVEFASAVDALSTAIEFRKDPSLRS
jgi:hypothetical protein